MNTTDMKNVGWPHVKIEWWDNLNKIPHKSLGHIKIGIN